MVLDLKTRALRDIWAFADLIDFKGGARNFYEIHKEMAEMNCRNQQMADTKRQYRRRIFLIPREHYKSTVNTVLYALWRIYRNPEIRIIIMCCIKELAQDMMREIKAYLEDPDLIETVWNDRPHIEGDLIPRIANPSTSYKRNIVESDEYVQKVIWTASAIQVNRELKDKQPTLQVLSVGMTPTGKHCDLVIMDDIVEWDNSATPQLAKKVLRSANEIESVVTKKAKKFHICNGFWEWLGNEVLINGTRYYRWDYYSKFVGNDEKEQEERLARTRYSAMIRDVYVNGVDSSDGYLCEEIFDAEAERDVRDTISRREWYAQYRNKIVAEDETTYSKESVKLVFPTNYRKTAIPAVTNFVDTSMPIPNGYEVFPISLWLTVDLAVSTRKRADDRAIAVGGWDELHRLHFVDGAADTWTPDELYTQIHRLADKWNITLVHYETGVGMQESFNHAFRTYNQLHKLRTLVPVGLPVIRNMTKAKKIDMTIQPLIASQSLYVNSLVWNNTPFQTELENFDPSATVNQDNMLDTLYMMAQNNPLISRGQMNRMNFGRHVTHNTMFGGTR